MGLKQDIVIVNEYTIRKGDGSGSRGATPGQYVTRYMARDLATEVVEPISRDNLIDYQLRYMARADAVDAATDVADLKGMMYEAQGDGGVAFGYGEVSLSHDALHAGAADVQRLFDEGKTVMKTVLSFSQEYLERMGIVEEGFDVKERGDYRGHIDQTKLRMAVMQGMRRMNAVHYDNLRYVGVIQVDTLHVHAHLAIVDAGKGTLAKDGTQKGKISQRAMSTMRRSLDSYLDEKSTVPHLVSAVSQERVNVVTYVKRWAHQQVLRESLPQFLIACLPEDRNLWRASTNHQAMKKPNRIVTNIVEEILSRPGSPMESAMMEIEAYAAHRVAQEGLTKAQGRKLVETKRAQAIERSVNAVYSLLRNIPEQNLTVRTPMLEAMSADREEIARMAAEQSKSSAENSGPDLIGFAYRLRSYSTRLEHHVEERKKWRERAREWELADEVGAATPESRALYEFFLEEEEYNAKCAAKYRSYLAFSPAASEWRAEWAQVEEYGDKLMSLEAMRSDPSIVRMKDYAKAEAIGIEAYGQPGGALVAQGGAARGEVDERIEKMRATWEHKVSDLRADMAGRGMLVSVKELTASEAELYDEGDAPVDMSPPSRKRRTGRRAQRPQGPPTGRFVATGTPGTEYPIEDVKGLDMHHLRWDYSSDAEVGPKTLARYVAQQERRSAALDKALEYLDNSDQMAAANDLPVRDIEEMERTVAAVSASGKLTSTVAELQRQREVLRRSSTVRLGTKVNERIETGVNLAIAMMPSPESMEIEAIESGQLGGYDSTGVQGLSAGDDGSLIEGELDLDQMRAIQRAQERLDGERGA